VGIDQARHQRPALAIDHARIPGTTRPGVRPDSLDPTVLHDHPSLRLRVASGAVKQRRVLEDEFHGG